MRLGGLPKEPDPDLGSEVRASLVGGASFMTTPLFVAHNGKQEDNTRISELETENKRLSEMVQKLHKEQQSLEDDIEKNQCVK